MDLHKDLRFVCVPLCLIFLSIIIPGSSDIVSSGANKCVCVHFNH